MRETQSPDLSNILKVANSTTTPDERTGRRIFAKIDEMTAKKKSRLNPLLLLYYTPALRMLLVVLLFLPILIFIAFQTGLPVYVTDYPITLVSASGGYGADGAPKRPGERLAQNDRIVTGENITCVVMVADSATISVLPESRASVGTSAHFSREIDVSLGKGMLYLDKKKSLAFGKKLAILMDDYRFIAEGTRALFERTEDSLSAACFDGRIKVAAVDRQTSTDIATIAAGEKINISLTTRTGSGAKYSIESPGEDDIRADESLRENPESAPEVFREQTRESDSSVVARTLPEKKETRTSTQAESGLKNEKDLYTKVTEVARLGYTADGSNIRLFFTIVSGDSLYICTSDRLYRVMDGRVDEPVRFQDRPFFTSRLVMYGNLMVLTETSRIHIIDTITLEKVRTIQLSSNEAVEDGYSPRMSGSVLYIPIRNRGYCSIDLKGASYILTDVYDEPFPISPLPAFGANRLVIGSFYENYIALLNGGKELWKLPLSGKSFSNVATARGRLYSYLLEGSIPKIIEISEDGSITRSWKLDSQVASDILAYEAYIVGMYTDGTLFTLDTAASTLAKPLRMFTTQLSTRSLRYVSPLFSDGKVYAGNEKGEIVIYDLRSAKIDRTVLVKKGEAFYTGPVLFDGLLYAVSNEGMLYSVSM